MRVTCLIENTTDRPDMHAEHGLSLYLETASHRILFDTGQTGAFADNAETLGIDLSQVDTVILSHGHYDHGGGLKRFFSLNQTSPVYISPHAFEPHYHGPDRYIGLDPELRAYDRFIPVDGDRQLDGELTILTGNGRETPFGVEAFGLQTEEKGRLVPDDFRHEQYLLIREGSRSVLVSGCSHRGILNIHSWVPTDVLIGGFHLSGLSVTGLDAVRLEAAAKELLKGDTTYFTGHCTGKAPYEFLKRSMKDRLRYLSSGMTLEV